MRVPSVTFYVKTGVRRGCLLSPSESLLCKDRSSDEGSFCYLLCKDRSEMRVPSVAFYVKTGVR